MQSILSFGAHAFPDVPSRNCPKSQCSSWRFAPVPPVRTGRGYGVDTGPLPAAGAAWSGAAQDAVTGGGRRAWKADCTQRPYTRLRGSAGAGWSGAARDDVAGGCGGGADSDCAQRPYTRLRGSAGAGWSGALRYGVARGCGGARIRTTRNDPIRGCVGRPGRAGRVPRETTWLAVVAGRGFGLRATTLYAAAWVGRGGMVGGRVGQRGRRLRRGAECELRATTLYAAVRAGGPRWSGTAWDGAAGRGAEREMRTACNDPIWGMRLGRVAIGGGVPEGVAFGFGEPRNANLQQRPYTRLCRSAGSG